MRTQSGKQAKAGYHYDGGILPFCFEESSSLCSNLVVTLYDALGAIAVYVRTGRACTPLARCNTLDFVPKSVCQGA